MASGRLSYDSRTDLTLDGQLCALSCLTQWEFSCFVPYATSYDLPWADHQGYTRTCTFSAELSETVLLGNGTHLGTPLYASCQS